MSVATLPPNVTTREAPVQTLMDRVQAEYAEMPGLSVTLSQAQRLWAVNRATCEEAFTRLVRRGVLRVTTRGRFVRR
jgi:hypothetical protein